MLVRQAGVSREEYQAIKRLAFCEIKQRQANQFRVLPRTQRHSMAAARVRTFRICSETCRTRQPHHTCAIDGSPEPLIVHVQPPVRV